MHEALFRISFDARKLFSDHPPLWRHPNKTALFEMAYSAGAEPQGRLEVTRWRAEVDGDVRLQPRLESEIRPNFYDYRPPQAGWLAWHVNFADPRLFGAYASGLFAQDEMQVSEHPLLGSVREALLAADLPARTTDIDGPSPILVRGVERRLEVRTDPDSAGGRPQGLYGNRFATASVDVVRRAARVITPPTTTNLIAMAAPSGGWGTYQPQQVKSILETALTAFAAARCETTREFGSEQRVAIHTGFWGCGAFGGNRRLMIALQALAARGAGIDRLVFHAGDEAGVRDVEQGLEVADMLAEQYGPTCPLADLVDRCVRLEYKWGVSDGN